MNAADHFVIVIEADNNRALAAYTKGLADLELIWPQLMEYAAGEDAKRTAEYQARLEHERQKQERNDQRMREYREEMKRWNEKTILRVPEPKSPWVDYGFASMPYPPSLVGRVYESIRTELKHMADVAGAAIGPFRMTEHQVRAMVAWEDGTRIDELKAKIVTSKTKESE